MGCGISSDYCSISYNLKMGSVCNTCNDPNQPGGHNDVGMPRIEVQK